VPPPPALRVESAVSAPTPPLESASHSRQDTELYPEATANPVRRVADQPVSTFAMETDTAAYANARSFITGASRLPPASAVRVEEFLNYFRYDYPRPSDRSRPFETTVSVAPSPWAPQKQLIHVGLSGYDLTPSERPPLNLVLLVDVSGSMSDESKLPLAKRALRILATRLTARDRVSIVVYAGAAGVALESTAGNNTRDIVCALDRLQAGGSTAGGQGISRAYDLARNNRQREGINRVILLTDGDFNVGISDPDRLKDYVRDQARDNNIYLSVFGFGMRDNSGGDNYNDTMMQALAQNGNGVAAFIDTLSEARRVFDREVSSTLFPIANDVKAQIEFNPAKVAEWRLIGYETRALNREDFNNDAVDAGEIGSGHQVTALYEITPVGAPEAIDPLRYQPQPRPTPGAAVAGEEIAFLRLRYKLPGETDSRLIERPITQADVRRSIAAAPQDFRWAAAVAAFAQQLRNDPWIPQSWSYGDTSALAQSAQGQDSYGDRAEFIALVERARGLQRQ
jgi:Ca-activated chloride channel homolog